MKSQLPKEEFELNLLFKEKRNPVDTFNKISEAFSCLNLIDEYYLSLADNSLQVNYELTNLEYSSIKTKIAQVLREIPDEAISNLDWKKLLGHFLLKLKYRFLRFLETNKEIESSEQLQNFLKEVEDEKKIILKDSNFILSDANIFILLNFLEKLVSTLKKLNDDECLEYKSEYGSVTVDNKIGINKALILFELGDKSSISETTEILKIKSTDFLSSEKMWSFKLGNKSINAKITDLVWLNKYYKRDFPLYPNDSLKVKLKIIFNSKENGSIYSPHYEIPQVLDVIYPENDDSESLF